ncbi:MAG TPA: hypothetical protein VFT22_07740 [Kofleriaceae bacterium]|nr:hypothetical protein [Kofleriaceae bacterium]
MAWHPATIARVLALLLALVAISACGGGGKNSAAPRTPDKAELKAPPPPPETEADRERKRHAEAITIIPDGSSCLPQELKNANAPRLELAAIGSDAVVCAIDQDRTRLLGPVGCWNIDVRTGGLTYQPAAPLPGRGLSVLFDDRCARGFCLPGDAKVPNDSVALMAWNLEGSKVAVLAADTVHIFDAQSKAHESSFSIRGDRGVTNDPISIDWNGDALFVEASDGTTSPVWVFKPDGTALGPIEALGGKDKTPLSTRNGSFVLLDHARVAISEQGFSTLTVYEIDTGKRSKLVRKIPAGPCKKDELDALWRDPSTQVSPRCKDFVAKTFSHLVGADAVAGTKNLLVLLRGPRLGELAVIDAKTLAERKTIKMPWCEGPGADKAAGAPPAERASAAPAAATPKKAAKPGPKPKDDADDPDAGGQ